MTSRPPSFSSFVAFEAAARYESFVRAADELNLTQSAISHAIRALEDRLGEALFERRGRRVILTLDGARLAQRVRTGLSILTGVLDDADLIDDAERVIIGAPHEFARHALLPRLAETDLLGRCEVRTMSSTNSLIEGSVDLLVARGPGPWSKLRHRLLAKDSIFPVAAPALAGREGDPMALPLIENLAHPWRLWLAQTGQGAAGAQLGLVVDDWSLALEAARAGVGACLASHALVRGDIASGRLIRVGHGELSMDDGYHLLWSPTARGRPAVTALIDLLTTEPIAGGPASPSTDRAPPPHRLRLVAPAAALDA